MLGWGAVFGSGGWLSSSLMCFLFGNFSLSASFRETCNREVRMDYYQTITIDR